MVKVMSISLFKTHCALYMNYSIHVKKWKKTGYQLQLTTKGEGSLKLIIPLVIIKVLQDNKRINKIVYLVLGKVNR